MLCSAIWAATCPGEGTATVLSSTQTHWSRFSGPYLVRSAAEIFQSDSICVYEVGEPAVGMSTPPDGAGFALGAVAGMSFHAAFHTPPDRPKSASRKRAVIFGAVFGLLFWSRATNLFVLLSVMSRMPVTLV